jgi:serine/threonine protein kinase
MTTVAIHCYHKVTLEETCQHHIPLREKHFLDQLSHPFILNSLQALSDDNTLYLITSIASVTSLSPSSSSSGYPGDPYSGTGYPFSNSSGYPGYPSPGYPSPPLSPPLASPCIPLSSLLDYISLHPSCCSSSSSSGPSSSSERGQGHGQGQGQGYGQGQGHGDGMFHEKHLIIFAACVVSVLHYCHSKHIIHRGIHPDSLLIHPNGTLQVSDWGFAKHVTDRTYTLCGHVEYLSPEAICGETGYGRSVDYWALGVLIFEMLVGRSAFIPPSVSASSSAVSVSASSSSVSVSASSSAVSVSASSSAVSVSASSSAVSARYHGGGSGGGGGGGGGGDDSSTIDHILTSEPFFPSSSSFPHPAKSIIQSLCAKSVTQRLGCRKGGQGIDEIQNHIWFRQNGGIDWMKLHQGELPLTLPWLPREPFVLFASASGSMGTSSGSMGTSSGSMGTSSGSMGTSSGSRMMTSMMCASAPKYSGYNCHDWKEFQRSRPLPKDYFTSLYPPSSVSSPSSPEAPEVGTGGGGGGAGGKGTKKQSFSPKTVAMLMPSHHREISSSSLTSTMTMTSASPISPYKAPTSGSTVAMVDAPPPPAPPAAATRGAPATVVNHHYLQ